jgi:dihydrofolate synthase / folylpolyglutamate synthase
LLSYNNQMNFDESVSYLYSLGNEVTAMKLGLENPRKLFKALGNPHEKYLKVQVAGTNGKGSTCAFLDSICLQANIKTGLFTSPHLISITERIKINGQEISHKDFAKYATKVRKTTEAEKLYATFFEQITAIALIAFAENNVELAILETGLGGRLDATTAANAEIVAITPIDLDHQQYLGETLAEIAGEKAAIIRFDTKVVVSPQNNECKKVIDGRCREVGVEPVWATENIKISESNKQFYNPLTASFTTKTSNYSHVDFEYTEMRGRHQITNASVAISLAEILQDFGYKITRENIIYGLETTKYKGRLEFYNGMLFDGSHNIAGAKALRAYLEEFISQPITLVFGAMKDKQIAEIAEILFPIADKLILTQPENSRSATAKELSQFTEKECILTENVAEALEKAKSFSGNLTCVTGSLYLVGETQKLLDN